MTEQINQIIELQQKLIESSPSIPFFVYLCLILLAFLIAVCFMIEGNPIATVLSLLVFVAFSFLGIQNLSNYKMAVNIITDELNPIMIGETSDLVVTNNKRSLATSFSKMEGDTLYVMLDNEKIATYDLKNKKLIFNQDNVSGKRYEKLMEIFYESLEKDPSSTIEKIEQNADEELTMTLNGETYTTKTEDVYAPEIQIEVAET